MKKVNIFDFEFTCSESIDEIATAVSVFESKEIIGSKKKPFLITPNVDDIVNWNKKKYMSLRGEFQNSAFIIPDGQPLVTFSKLVSRSLIRRITGSSLFPILWQKIKQQEKKVFFILANEELCRFYEKEYPFAIAYYPPFFKEEDHEVIREIVNECRIRIEAHQPEFVFVGIQFPKQNIVALGVSKSLKIARPLFLILGSSMEYYSGHLSRSPVFFQKIGMEWFYRFCQQPKRLFKRYFINDVAIIPIFFREFFNKPKNSSEN